LYRHGCMSCVSDALTWVCSYLVAAILSVSVAVVVVALNVDVCVCVCEREREKE
jgi:hypothetical protein